MRSNIGKKVLSVLLSVLLLISVINFPVLAEPETDNWIEVRTVLDLYNIRLNMSGNYKLMNDIDLTAATAQGGDWDYNGNGWNPIGSQDTYAGEEFSGIFDGNGHKIIGLRITKLNSKEYVGLFANVSGTIRNLRMEDLDISGTNMKNVGGICAYSSGLITNCSVAGTIKNAQNAGGITGVNEGTISKCYNEASVTDSIRVAGITGTNKGTIEYCYNTGTVLMTNYQGCGGGIAGYLDDAEATVKECYNTGKTTYHYFNQGDRTGLNQAISGSGSCSNCYYLYGSGNGQSGSISLTQAQMSIQSMYPAFDFENVWVLKSNAFYPYPQLRSNPQNLRALSDVTFVAPNKTIYSQGEELDLTGSSIEIQYEDGQSESVAVTADMVSGYNKNQTGEQTVTVAYANEYISKSFTFSVLVNERPFKEVRTIEDLYNIRYDLSANYILMNDLDLSEATSSNGSWSFAGAGWNPIGSNDRYAGEEFSGIFDGNDHIISGLSITISNYPAGTGSDVYQALFANSSGQIKNLHLDGVTISNTKSNNTYCAALVAYNSGLIVNCSVNGILTSTYKSDTSCLGGLVGYNKGTVDKCYNEATIDSAYISCGGISGCNAGVISKSYNTGDIRQTGSTVDWRAGGISGNTHYGVGGRVTECYNTGIVTYNDKASVAIFSQTIEKSYFLAGSGLDKEGSISLTDYQMRIPEMFQGFDFENTWILNPNANYPYPQLRSNIQDLNETVTLIRVIAYPAKMEYQTGDELELLGGMFEAVFVSGRTELLPLSLEYVSGFDTNVAGEQELTVTYGGMTDTFTVMVTKRPEVVSATLVSGPATSEFVIGTSFDFSGAKASVTYDNGETGTVDITEQMVSGADINHLGTQTVTVTLDAVSLTFSIKVVPASLSEIAISKLPDKTVYIEGENFDSTGMELTGTYSNGNSILITSGFTVTGFESTPGNKTLTVDFVGKKATFEVTVNARVLTGIRVQSIPAKTEYVVGEELDLTGMVIVGTYETGPLTILQDYTVSGMDGTAGIKVITVEFGGKSTSFTVKVSPKVVESLVIKSAPVKLEYIENEPMDLTGLEVEATYNNGVKEMVTDYEVTGFSSNPGTHELFITYGGQAVSFSINVTEKQLLDVRITLPTKTTYEIGETFDSTGLVVTACYNNGQEDEVDDYTLSGFDSTATGAKELTVAYGGLIRKFVVTVAEKSVIDSTGAVKVGSKKARLGETVEVPVEFSKNPGLTAFKHTFTFDAARLAYASVTASGGFTSGTVVVNDEKAATGEVTVLWFQAEDVNTSGVAYTLNFTVLETAADGEAAISVSFGQSDHGNASGEDVLFGTVGGAVEVLSYWLGDLDGDRTVTMADLLRLAQYVSGKTMTLTEKQLKSADVNEDGSINVHDLTLLSQWLLDAEM